MKHNTSGFLLVSPTHTCIDRPINTNGITKTLQRISAEHFDGKKVGSSLTRHMYMSEKYGKNVLDKRSLLVVPWPGGSSKSPMKPKTHVGMGWSPGDACRRVDGGTVMAIQPITDVGEKECCTNYFSMWPSWTPPYVLQNAHDEHCSQTQACRYCKAR